MIRLFRPQDLEKIMEIGDAAWREIYRMYRQCYGGELFELEMPDSGRIKGIQIKEHALTHPQWILICEQEGRIVGFLSFMLDEKKKIGVIGNNAVDPACGLKGIGQQMYGAAFDRFREEGMRYARVTTGLDEAHARARRAYERAGFDIRHENITYYKKL